MYLFTRTARIRNGQQAPAVAWAMEMTGRVNQMTDLGVQLWTTILSPGLGTLAWSALVPDLTTLNSADDKLAADPSYLSELTKSADLMADDSVDDVVMHLIHTAGDAPADAHFAEIVTSAASAGHLARAGEIGVEVAERAATLSGSAASFFVAATGPYGGCAWISTAETLDALEEGLRKVTLDPGFIAYLDDHTAGVYRPELSIQSMWRRLM